METTSISIGKTNPTQEFWLVIIKLELIIKINYKNVKKSEMFSQMSQFMSSDNDSRKTSCIFDNGDRVDFLKTFINDASAADVCESCSAAITFAITTFASTHVQSVNWGQRFI